MLLLWKLSLNVHLVLLIHNLDPDNEVFYWLVVRFVCFCLE